MSGPGRAEIRDGAAAAARRPARCGCARCYGALSRGTEALIFAGRVPESEYERMRAPFMGGTFPVSGEIRLRHRRPGRGRAADLLGRIVFALHPHQTLFDVPAEAVVPVPEDVPPRRAVLAANMETALNAVWDARAWARRPHRGGRRAAWSALLVAYLCARLPGARGDAGRHRSGARRAGARARRRASRRPDAAPADCDLVFHASATAAGLATALRLAGDEATIVELSWYGAGDVAVPLGGAFHSRRLRLDLEPGRQGRAVAPPALDASPPAARRRSRCSPSRCSTRCSRRRSRFDELPARLPSIS